MQRRGINTSVSSYLEFPMPEIIRCLLLLLADFLTLVYPSGSTPAGKKRILIVKLDAIGDFILWLDAAKDLRSLYPAEEYELFLLGNQAWCDLATEFTFFDHIWPLDRHHFIYSFSYRFKLLKKIRQSGFSSVIHPTYSRELFLGDIIVMTCGAPDKIGSVGNCTNTSRWGKLLSDRWYTRLVSAAPGVMMELQRNAEFMRGIGLTDFRAALPDLTGLAGRYGTLLNDPYYVIVPGAGMQLKQWPVAHFKEVARRIHVLTGLVGIICGAPGEEELGAALVEGGDIPLINIVGKTSLLKLVGIVAGARIVVGNDSAAIHLAAAVATPAVCLLGGGQYGRFFPYQVDVPTSRPFPVSAVTVMECFDCDWRCRYDSAEKGPAPCASQIQVETVMSQIVKIISDITSEA